MVLDCYVFIAAIRIWTNVCIVWRYIWHQIRFVRLSLYRLYYM